MTTSWLRSASLAVIKSEFTSCLLCPPCCVVHKLWVSCLPWRYLTTGQWIPQKRCFLIDVYLKIILEVKKKPYLLRDWKVEKLENTVVPFNINLLMPIWYFLYKYCEKSTLLLEYHFLCELIDEQTEPTCFKGKLLIKWLLPQWHSPSRLSTDVHSLDTQTTATVYKIHCTIFWSTSRFHLVMTIHTDLMMAVMSIGNQGLLCL